MVWRFILHCLRYYHILTGYYHRLDSRKAILLNFLGRFICHRHRIWRVFHITINSTFELPNEVFYVLTWKISSLWLEWKFICVLSINLWHNYFTFGMQYNITSILVYVVIYSYAIFQLETDTYIKLKWFIIFAKTEIHLQMIARFWCRLRPTNLKNNRLYWRLLQHLK